VSSFLAGKLKFFLLSQLIVQIETAKVKPPIQEPVMVSSIPSQREIPTPAPTATTQTGQTANAVLAVRSDADTIAVVMKFLFKAGFAFKEINYVYVSLIALFSIPKEGDAHARCSIDFTHFCFAAHVSSVGSVIKNFFFLERNFFSNFVFFNKLIHIGTVRAAIAVIEDNPLGVIRAGGLSCCESKITQDDNDCRAEDPNYLLLHGSF